MSAPLSIKFATDHSAAKSGMQDLAASVVSNMVKVSEAMGIGVDANGGFAAATKRVAGNIVTDMKAIGAAGLKAANDSEYSAVATIAAVSRTAAATQTGAMVQKGAYAVAGEAAKAHYNLIRTEATATAKVLASSPLFVAGTALTGVLLVVGAYQVLKAAAIAASEALEHTAKVGDDAARLGVSTTFLQTWSVQAKTLKLDVDEMRKSLDMARAAFTVKLGDGADARNESSFAARLRAHQTAGNLTPEQTARFSAARGTEAQYRVALDLMSEMTTKGRELAALDLAERIMPPALVDRIRQGVTDFDRLRKGIDDIKNPNLVLLSPDEIVRAQELQRRLDAAEATLDKAGAEFRHELALAGEGLKADAISWKELMAGGASLAVSILKQARQYVDQQEATRPAIYGVDYYREEDRPASGLAKDVGKNARTGLPSTGDKDRDDALNRLRGNLKNETLVGQAVKASNDMVAWNYKDRSNSIGGKTPSKSSSSLDQVETFINSLEKSTAALKAEVEAYSLSNAEKQEAIQLAKLNETAQQAGIKVTEEQTERVRAAAKATGELKDSLQDLAQAEQQFGDTVRHFGSELVDVLDAAMDKSKSLADVLQSIAKSELKNVLSALITGTGPLAGLLGTATKASEGGGAVGGLGGLLSGLFKGGAAAAGDGFDLGVGDDADWVGGFRANGGPVKAGRAYTVGELGQELFVPGQDGRIVPIGAGGAGGGTSPTGTMIIKLDNPTGDAQIRAMVAAGVTTAIASYDQQQDRRLPGRVDRARMRYAPRL